VKAGKSVKALVLGCFLLTLGAASPAWAIAITVSFTAGGISGSIDYNAASVTSNTITSLNSINLTIVGTTYTVAELGTTSNVCGFSCALIGTTAGGLGNVASFSNEFALYFDAGSDAGIEFAYATDNSVENSLGFSLFSITADTAVSGTAVPEPGSLVVFLAGLAGLGGLVAHRCRPVGKVSLDWANP
jgi:hypothetical protein